MALLRHLCIFWVSTSSGHWYDIPVVATHVLAGVMGGAGVWFVVFMRRDQQGRVQNRLEVFLAKVDDLQRTATTRHTAFIQETAVVLNSLFERLFGAKLFSLQSVAVALCYTCSSFLFIVLCMGSHQVADVRRQLFAWAIGLFALGVAPLLLKNDDQRFRWVGIVGCVAAYAGIRLTIGAIRSGTVEMMALLGLALCMGILFHTLFIAANRKVLRKSIQLNKFSRLVLMFALNTVLATVLVGPLIIIMLPGKSFRIPFAKVFVVHLLVATTNLIPAIVAVGVMVLMLTAMVHRMFWPFVSNPLSNLADYGLVDHKKAVLISSLSLLAYATGWERLSKLI